MYKRLVHEKDTGNWLINDLMSRIFTETFPNYAIQVREKYRLVNFMCMHGLGFSYFLSLMLAIKALHSTESLF